MSGSIAASSPCDSDIAYRPKPMICSASCGNWVATRCDRASAVCFIGPQRPSANIEYDRSTQSATAADARRSVSATSKSSGSSRTGSVATPPDRPGAAPRCRSCGPRPAAARRRTPSAATTPVSSPAAPASRRSCSPRVVPVEVGEDLGAARCRRAGAAPSGDSVSPSSSAGHPALPAQLALQLPQPAHVVGRGPAELPLHRLDVDVVEGRAGVLLAELVEQVVEVGRSRRARRSRRRSRGPRRRASARRGPRRGRAAAPAGCR